MNSFQIQFKIMKKLLIISIVLLLGVSGNAQDNKRIDEKLFYELVDYVNCQYANEYIKNYPNKSENDQKAYVKAIQPIIGNSDINKSIKGEDLFKLLKKNNWSSTADKLVQNRINNLKFESVSKKTDSEIIEDIVKVDNGGIRTIISDDFINETKNKLIEYLKKGKSNAENVQPGGTTSITSNAGSNNSAISNPKPTSQPPKGENKSTIDIIIGIIHWVITILLGFFVFKIKRGLKVQNRQQSEAEQQPKEKEKGLSEEGIVSLINKRLSDERKLAEVGLTNKINAELTSEENLRKISMKVSEIQTKSNNKTSDQNLHGGNDAPEQDLTPKAFVKFVKEREGDLLFKEALEENAFYEIFDIKGNKASYRYCGNVDRAMANYDAVLKDVFDDNGTYSSRAKQIKNISSGTVEQQQDGKWKIIIPAKINFI